MSPQIEREMADGQMQNSKCHSPRHQRRSERCIVDRDAPPNLTDDPRQNGICTPLTSR